ncbi:MAG: hypothetical protein GX804_00405 [Lentisphaerae bacterium]|nr:hypothetical protein [Lentisphaerota bacterium]
MHEIIPPDLKLYKQLKRVSIELPPDLTTRQTWEEVAHDLTEHEQVLCIVNSRKDCHALHKLMPPDTIHLSALMCGAHRSSIIAYIKDALAMAKPIRVISTQLVEAGVDIDFPVVYRAFAGLPSIAQAAGRCNREGNLAPALGKVIVFMPPEPSKVTALRKAEDTTLDLLSNDLDIDSPDSYPSFFEHFYNRQNDLGASFHDWLSKDAYDLQFQFREAATAFRMIDQSSVSVIIRYANNDSLINSLITVGPKRNIMRGLQRYTVTVPRSMVVSLKQKGFIEEPHDGIFIQTIPSLYSLETGLDIFRDGLTVEECII